MAQPHSTLLSALQEARRCGILEDIFLDQEDRFTTSSGVVINPQIIEVIPCISCGATLYLVSGENTLGTWVHHWDI